MLFKSFLKNKSYVFFALCVSYFVFSCSEIGDPKTEAKEKTGTQAKKKTDVQRQGLKGKVKTLEHFDFHAKSDKAGKVEKGDLSYKYTYAYDDKGNLIEWKRKGSLVWSLVYKETSTYNDKGNRIESKSYKADGTFLYKSTYAYDDKGNLIERKNYKADGSLDTKYVFEYKYDSEGNWIEKIKFQVKSEGGKKEATRITERKITYH